MILLVVLSCGIMAYSYFTSGPSPVGNVLGAISAPLKQGLSSVGGFFQNIFGYFYRFSQLEEENAQLKAELERYQNLEIEYYEAISENETLRDLNLLRAKRRDFVCEPCDIISASTSLARSSMTLSRGSLSGIEAGDCVLTNAGLIGYVASVGLNYCEVVTITDMTIKVGATVSRTREAVVAEGSFELSGEGKLRISYLSNDSDVRPGDVIETSGFGEMYPKGVIIGTIEEVLIEPHGISSYAIIEPAVDFKTIKSVFVVKEFEIVD